jgi:Xaa-Pro aminopeptidase
VAAGENACVLHYTENTSMIKSNDLILIDAGGELGNYAADITRTFPKNGKFSDAQQAIYQIVLDAQKAGIALIKPGVVWTKIQEVMIKIISQGLLSLGILQGTLKEVIETKAYLAFYMHNSGHWLGLDVHDQGAYKEQGQWRTLKAGMVLTVEPGVYIAAHHNDVHERWHNIGVRIEDDILVTADGHENLTSAVPREVVEIEALMCHAV